MTNQITQVIDTIAQKLGVMAEDAYPTLIKQAEVSAVSYRIVLWVLGISALVLVISIIGAAFTSNSYNKESITMACLVLIFISGIVALIAGINAAAGLQNYLTAIHNPDAWVIQYVTNLI